MQERTNVILLGDSLGDPQMAHGMEKRPQHIIKIGFLNHDVSCYACFSPSHSYSMLHGYLAIQ